MFAIVSHGRVHFIPGLMMVWPTPTRYVPCTVIAAETRRPTQQAPAPAEMPSLEDLCETDRHEEVGCERCGEECNRDEEVVDHEL